MNRHPESRPARVLAVFLHDYRWGDALGGIERRFIEVSKHLPSLGIQLFALEYSPPLSRFMPSGYHSIELSRLRPRTAIQDALHLIQGSIISAFWCMRLKCDLVYSPSSAYTQVLPSFFVSVLLRKPLVVVFHSLPQSGYRASFSDLLRSKLAAGESLRKALVKIGLEYLRRIACARASACLAVSKETARQILQSFTPRIVAVSGNGVSEAWFDRGTAPKKFDACFLGRISPRKGIDLLLLCWTEVLRKYPSAKLVLIGGGESQRYAERCRKMIQALGLGENVTMTGFLDDESVRYTLHSSRTFVLPSSREGFGLAIVEAMASGLPCILPNLPSLKENFGGSAVFVERPEPEAWAMAICGLLGDEETQGRLSRSGRDLASQFSWKHVAEKEAEIIHRLILRQRKLPSSAERTMGSD